MNSRDLLLPAAVFGCSGCRTTAPAVVPDGAREPASAASELAERALRRRAVEAVIWAMPAVNQDLTYQAIVRDANAGAGSTKIVHGSRLSDWKNQTLTPDPDAVCFMPFFDTNDVGPMRRTTRRATRLRRC
jgi:hypothetical protein